MKGYYGIGIYNFKTNENVGSLFRAAYALGASFVFTVGRKYTRQSSDTVDCVKQIPYHAYDTIEEMNYNLPKGCRLVCVETWKNGKDLNNFCHPKQAAYLLGNEANGLPEKLSSNLCVKIPSKVCLNVANAGAIVLYSRLNTNSFIGV